MPRKEKKITSIYLPVEILNWIKEQKLSVSEFIEKATEARMNEEFISNLNFENQKLKIQDEIGELNERIEEAKNNILKFENIKNDRLKELENLEKEHIKIISLKRKEKEKIEKEKDVDTLAVAILKVNYRNSAECAKDLEELKPKDISWLKWLKIVDDKWKELKGANVEA